MTNNYQFIDILLALREEYKKLNKKLLTLKELTDTNSKKVEKCYYWINRWLPDVKPEMICHVELYSKHPSYYINSKEILLLKNNNDEYYLQDNNEISINNRNRENFNKTVNEIMSSDLVNNLYADMIKGTNTASTYVTRITPSKIRTFINNGIIKNTFMDYNSSLDTLTIADYPEKMDKELLIYLLSLDFSKESIPNYIQHIIDNSNTLDKKVLLSKNLNNKDISEFTFLDKEDKVILRKI